MRVKESKIKRARDIKIFYLHKLLIKPFRSKPTSILRSSITSKLFWEMNSRSKLSSNAVSSSANEEAAIFKKWRKSFFGWRLLPSTIFNTTEIDAFLADFLNQILLILEIYQYINRLAWQALWPFSIQLTIITFQRFISHILLLTKFLKTTLTLWLLDLKILI